jgi:predicted transcriptional regulator
MSEIEVFKALGDPIRIEMVKRLSRTSPQNLHQLSDGLGISRQGARKQLQVLVSSKLVQLKPVGRETRAHLEIDQLQQAKVFISRIEDQWDSRLEALKHFVESDSD